LTVRKQDEQRPTTAEMKFMRRTAGYSVLDHMRNKQILDKMKVTPVTEYANNYRQNWLQHVKRTDKARIPKQMLQYAPVGQRLPRRTKNGMEDDNDIP
jgi:hypothetical protein